MRNAIIATDSSDFTKKLEELILNEARRGKITSKISEDMAQFEEMLLCGAELACTD